MLWIVYKNQEKNRIKDTSQALMQAQDNVQSHYYWSKRQYCKEMEDNFKSFLNLNLLKSSNFIIYLRLGNLDFISE